MKDWRLHALFNLVTYLFMVAALLKLFVGLIIKLKVRVSGSVCGLIPTRLITCTYDVNK
jgi:hypothetical protein